jgi:transposase InsO family protein
VSIRRACRVLEVDTSTYHYKSRRREQAGLEARIREICQTRVRYGYRRVHVLLRREGWALNMKRTRRIYREMGLQLRSKPPRRRVKAKLREDRQVATQPNETWAMDFVHDQLATGRKIRVLTVVDIFTLLADAGCAVQLSRGGCGADAGTNVRRGWLSPDDPGRPGLGVLSAGILTCGPMRGA